jgi:hypothetical protein
VPILATLTIVPTDLVATGWVFALADIPVEVCEIPSNVDSGAIMHFHPMRGMDSKSIVQLIAFPPDLSDHPSDLTHIVRQRTGFLYVNA